MKLWEENIRRVVPYTPGEQPAGESIIKLNTNENPYPPALGVKKAMQDMDAGWLRKYPDPAAQSLVGCLADYYGVGQDQVFVGVGSDDVLATAFLTFFHSGKPVCFRILAILFIRCGRTFLGSPMKRRRWTKVLASGQRTTIKATGV